MTSSILCQAAPHLKGIGWEPEGRPVHLFAIHAALESTYSDNKKKPHHRAKASTKYKKLSAARRRHAQISGTKERENVKKLKFA